MTALTPIPVLRLYDNVGLLAIGAKVYTYAAGTSTPQATYTDASQTTPNANPVIANSRGEVVLWLATGLAYKIVAQDALGNLLFTSDNVTGADYATGVILANLADSTDVTKGDAMIAVKSTANGAVATTQHQVNEEDPSVFRFMTAAQIAAIEAETGSVGALVSTELQSAMDGVRPGATLGLNRYPVGTYQIAPPLRVKNGTPRITMRGDTRIRSILQPNAVDIKAAPVNINALIIVQDNNAHFCMENMRMTSSVPYTGIGIYCVENGGADGSGQCLFSGIFRNLWIDFSSTNSGFLTGGVQNTVFDTLTFENMKGCFTLQGLGTGDNFFRSLSLYNCFDQVFLQTADTNGAFSMTVDGVHAYNHNRGRLFDVQNWVGATINDIQLRPDAANLGDTGLFKFKNSTSLNVSNFYSTIASGVPACATGIELEGVTGKFSQGKINANIGLQINGTSAVDLEFENVDFTTCGTSCAVIAAALTGTLRTRGCKFNDAQLRCFVNTVAGGSYSWYSYDDEFINAGLGGNAGSRNLDLNTSGTIKLYSPRIGRTNGGAAAAYWIAAAGTGMLDIYDPEFVGTPPTGLIDPASTMTVTIHKSLPTGTTTQTGAAYTVLESDRDLVADRAGTVTYTLPTPSALNAGRRLNITTAQNQAAVSGSANVIPQGGGLAGTAILAATAGKWAELVSNGSAWRIMASN